MDKRNFKELKKKYFKEFLGKLLLILIVIIVLTCAHNNYKVQTYLRNSDVIVCIQFSGLKYLFHAPYEYYAIGSESACKIPEKKAMKQIGDIIEQEGKFRYSPNYTSWLIILSLDTTDNQESDENTIPYEKGYKLTYDSLTNINNPSMTSREQQVVLDITKKLYSNGTYNEEPSSPLSQVVLTYTVAYKDESFLIEVAENGLGSTLFRFTEAGDLIKVLELSEGVLVNFYFYTYK